MHREAEDITPPTEELFLLRQLIILNKEGLRVKEMGRWGEKKHKGEGWPDSKHLQLTCPSTTFALLSLCSEGRTATMSCPWTCCSISCFVFLG